MATQHTNTINLIKKLLASLGLKCLKEVPLFDNDKWRRIDLECVDSNGNSLAVEVDSDCYNGEGQCLINVRKLDKRRNQKEGNASCHIDIRAGTVNCKKNDNKERRR